MEIEFAHPPSSAADRRVKQARFVFLAILTALFALGSSGQTQVVKFDEKFKAPAPSGSAELNIKIRNYFDTYARVNLHTATGIVRDKDAYQQWFDTQWRLQRAIDTKGPLGDLSEFGLMPNGDGSYSVDLGQFPQWDPLPARLQGFREPQALGVYGAALKARGFRDQDIDAIRLYVEKSGPRERASTQELDIAEGFGAKVKAQMLAKQKIDSSSFLSYAYQTGRVRAEQQRVWAGGMLDALDQQRQRILESYLQEQGGHMTITPDDIDAEVKLVVGGIASGEFAKQLKAQRREAQQ
ncbi:MAG TPA: hypothetical protein VEZ88_11675 [Steroidobacteraceae bacterium]|nr:hypothetical protein [Steroidobacteraceae bacterium]